MERKRLRGSVKEKKIRGNPFICWITPNAYSSRSGPDRSQEIGTQCSFPCVWQGPKDLNYHPLSL